MEYQHFSHKHFLIPHHFNDDVDQEIKCKACNRLIIATEPSHGCLSCKHFLHDQCLNLPRWLQHPSHHSHTLTLLPAPTYPCGSYSCNACGIPGGSSFSFSCAQCEFDLHTNCATLPSTVLIDAHSHELTLTFDNFPSDGNISIVCDVCNELVNKSFWMYKCVGCGFDCHLNCVKTDQQAGLNPMQQETQEAGGQSRANDTMDSIRQATSQMIEDQFEIMRMQNELTRARILANFMTWSWR
ncbi:protein binding protein, putative [Ricinus communis]|uniref:Protein binding protein, putative n=2 Tax=Ricinus communis TaxID=3988 RepID=B9S7Y0_RICCO|nr:protein binding protein, putative [Ricinus communis]|eukprot:XP_002522096.1 uncharacterized protein LOC8268907 [Ricinus communis]